MAPLTPEQVWKLLGEQFPDLRTEGVERLDTGGEHYTFAVGNDLIFRFPRDAATAAKTAREVALLAELAPVLPLPVPTVRYLGRLSAWFPYLFTGQQRIAGVMGEVLRPPQEHWPQLAEQLGAFFSALHAFTVERAAGIGIRSRPLEAPEVLIADTVHYRPLIERACPELVSGPAAPYLRGDVLVPPPASLPLVMSHADLKGEHIFVSPDGASITGVIDWSDVALCEPSVDLQDLLIWLGPGFLRLVLEHYRGPVDEHILERAVTYRRYECLRAIGVRLARLSDDPLDLLMTQQRWAFA